MSTEKYTTVSDEDAITIVQNAVVAEHSQRRFRDRRVTLGLVVAFFFVACMFCAEHHHHNDTNGRSPHLKGRNDGASADHDNDDDSWGWVHNFCNEREWCTIGRQWFGHLVGVRPETTDPPSSSGAVQPTYNSYDSMTIMDDEDDDDDAYADDDDDNAYTVDDDDDDNDDDNIVEDDDGDEVVADEDDDVDDGKYDDDDSYDSDP